MSVAVTGATGFVGQAVLEVLARRGHPVRALARTIPGERGEADWIEGDLADRAALMRLVDGAGAVVHIAGLTSSQDLQAFEKANVAGTAHLIEAAAAARISRFVFTSSLAAREPSLSAYGASKAEAEALVKASSLDWTIVRPPAVFGPRDRDNLDLFRAAKWGIVPMPPPGAASWLYVADLAELLTALIGPSQDLARHTFEPDDGRAGGWSHRDWALAIGAAMDRKPWVPHLSRGWLERLASLDMAARGNKAKLTPDRVSYMTHPDWVSDANLSVPKGVWQPGFETHDALKATADWYRENGWL